MSPDRVVEQPALPEYPQDQWIPLGDFDDVRVKERPDYSTGPATFKYYDFRISGIGDFVFELGTELADEAMDENQEEDPSDIREIVVHHPGSRVESVMGRIKRLRKRFESGLYSFTARRTDSVYEPFIMQFKTPEGSIYTQESDKGAENVLAPCLVDAWEVDGADYETIPLVPTIIPDYYLNDFQIRVISTEK